MIIFYNFGMLLYVFAIRIASLFSVKAQLWLNGRKMLFENLENNNCKQAIWFHCASLGEFEMARPLIERIKQHYPEEKILITFFSPSGYEIRKDYPLADGVFYLPMDSAANANRFVKIIDPKMAIFSKYEFWHHYLQTLKRQQIPTYLISGLFRKSQRFFKWYGKFFRRDLTCFTKLFVQNEASAQLLKAINIESVVAGDNRYDRVYEQVQKAEELPKIKAFKEDQFLMVLGSSWPAEEILLAKQWKRLPENLKVIIAPHDISETHLQEIESRFKETVRYSKLTVDNQHKRVLIIDNIGILMQVYAYSEFAFVGGGFSGKLHNVLEPAAFGNIICFGENYERFPEAVEMIDTRAAFVADQFLYDQLSYLMSVPNIREQWRQKVLDQVQRHLGATDIIFNEIKIQLEQKVLV